MPDPKSDLQLTERTSSVRFGVRVRPRASRTAVLGVRDHVLEVAISAPPVEGEANKELVSALASLLGVARRNVTIVAGEKGRRKVIDVCGLERATVLARLTGG
jgi:uncharacterized protein (TIGR00251 family)